jgi:hypothetical protein
MGASKIATCCYCGSRAALVLRGQDRHELSCGTCGAPLRALKMMPVTAPMATAPRCDPRARQPEPPKKVARPQKRRKSKSIGRKLFSELWDVIEDVFD